MRACRRAGNLKQREEGRMDVEMRASDEDRQRIIDLLQHHTTAGRLTLDEFSERVGEVYSARTLGDLATVTRDLPAATGGACGCGSPAAHAPGCAALGVPGSAPTPVKDRRELLTLFAVAAIALVLLAVMMALRP